MKVAVLAVQGAFIEHEKALAELGAQSIELRQGSDALKSYDALILPGGESTVQSKLLHELNMFDSIKAQIAGGMPVLATCAGMILLAEHLSGDDVPCFQTIPMTVRRNAYGRQLGSFYTEQQLEGFGKVPMTFIRAPYVESASPDVSVLARVDGNIVAVRYKNQLALAFHPELNSDLRIYEKFLKQ